MAGVIGNLVINMAANISALRADLTQGANTLQSAGSRMMNMANNVKGALVGMAGALGVGLASAWIKEAIDAADAASKLSASTGTAIENIAGLQLAFDLGGAGGDALGTTMTKLNKEMVEGGKTLSAFGIKSKDLNGNFRDTKDVLYDVADAIAGTESTVLKTQLAMDLFGKSGADLLPLLNGGSAGFREMDEMARKLGLTFSEATGARAEEFNDSLDLLSLGSKGVARGIAAELLPTLTSLAGSFLESMTEGDRLKRTAEFLSTGLKILYSVALGIVEAFSTLGTVIGGTVAYIGNSMSGMADIVGKVMKGDFVGAFESAQSTAQNARSIVGATTSDISASWTSTSAAISKAWDGEGNAAVENMAKVMKAQKSLLAIQKERDEAEKKAAAARAAADKATADFVEALKKENEQIGLNADQVKMLAAARAASTARTEEERMEIMKWALANDIKTKSLAATTEAEKAAKEARDALASAGDKDLATVLEQLEAQRAQNAEYGFTSLQISELVARKLDLKAATESELAANLRVAAQYAGEYHDAYLQHADDLDKTAEATRALAYERRAGANLAETQRMWESIDKTAHDTFVNIFEGGKSAFDRLRDTLKSGLYDLLYQMTVKKWIVQIQGSMADGGSLASWFNAAGIGGESGGGLGSASSWLSMGKTLYSGFTGAFTSNIAGMATTFGNAVGSSTISAFGTGMTMTGSQAATAAGAYSSAAGGASTATGSALTAGSSVASAIPIIGWIVAAAMANNKFFKQGWSIDGAGGNQTMDMSKSLFGSGLKGNPFASVGGVATLGIGAADKLLRGIGLSDQAASLVSGSSLWTRGFGHKAPSVEEQGVTGNLSASGFNGQAYANVFEKGGWFRSDKRYTTNSALDAGTSANFGDTMKAMVLAVKGFGAAMGIESTQIDGYTKAISIALTQDEAKNKEAIVALFGSIGDELATTLVPSIAGLTKAGEPAAAALQRITGNYLGLDAVLDSIGMTFGKVGLASLSAREHLVDLTGGVANLAQQTSSFAENYLSEAERLAPVQASVIEQMAELGLAHITTRDQFKAEVMGLSQSGALATEAGAKIFAGMMSVESAFARVHPAIEATGTAAMTTAQILAQGAELQARYDELTKTTEQLEQRRVEGIHELNRALAENVAAAERAFAASEERKSLQEQLDELNMSSTEIAIKRRDAVLAENRDVYDSIIAREKALAVEDERRALQERVDRATRTAVQAQEDYLNSLDSANRALGLLALTAEAAKVAADELAAVNAGYDEQILALEKMRMTAEEVRRVETAGMDASTISRYDRLKQLEAENQATSVLSQTTRTAHAALVTAYKSESAALEATIDRMGAFGASLRSVRDTALLGSLSPLTPEEKYAEAKSQYERTLAAALNGDQAAQDNFQNALTAFLQASQIANASDSQYQADFARTQADLERAISWASSQGDVGRAQLALLESQVSGLIEVNESVIASGITVADAIRDLAAATYAQNTGDSINQLYRSLLGRNADSAGGEYWRERLASGVSLAEIAAAIKTSAEYISLHPVAPPPVVPVAPSVNFQSLGPMSMAPLVTEIRKLQSQLSEMHRERSMQTEESIRANSDANKKAAERVHAGVTDAAKTAAWTAKSKAVIT